MSGESVDKKILELIGNPATERAGFQLLHITYSERLYWHIKRFLKTHNAADDVLQDVLVKAWKGLKNFKGNSAVYTWLFRIASNECITHLNKNKKRAVTSIHDDENSIDESLSASAYIDTSKTLQLLQNALDTLPDKQKQVFCMRYYDERSYKQISEELNTSVGALKASYHHAVNKIEKYISQRF